MALIKTVSVRVTEEERNAWQAAADAEGLPLQTWVRRRIDLGLLGEDAWERIEAGRKAHRAEMLEHARAVKAAKAD